jgi:putative addiction module component (TIGR02574 family)
MVDRDTILQQALSLSADDRAYVATALEDSLSPKGTAASSEAFLAELKRRSAAYRDGTTTARPAADALADLRRRQARPQAAAGPKTRR